MPSESARNIPPHSETFGDVYKRVRRRSISSLQCIKSEPKITPKKSLLLVAYHTGLMPYQAQVLLNVRRSKIIPK